MTSQFRTFDTPYEVSLGHGSALQIVRASRDGRGVTAELQLIRGPDLIDADQVHLNSSAARDRYMRKLLRQSPELELLLGPALLQILASMESLNWTNGNAHQSPESDDNAESSPSDIDYDASDGAHVLDSLDAYFRRYVVFPSDNHRYAVVLWTAHSHCIRAFESTPRLDVSSPEKRSGKTRLLETMELVLPNPMYAVNITPAALYRTIAEKKPTLLLDEADAIFGPKASNHEDLRALLNAGYRKGAKVYRVVGDNKDRVEAFSAFCAVALAGLGDLPDTIRDRSIRVPLKRRAPGEVVEPFRRGRADEEAAPLRRRLAAWTKPLVLESHPEMPENLIDRAADVWEPLLLLADAAGGSWPLRAREAAVMLDAEREANDGSLGTRLLGDVQKVFNSPTNRSKDHLASAELVGALVGLDEAPWSNLRGRPLGQRGLAVLLKGYGIAPCAIRVGDKTLRGYKREHFWDAWQRYLPPLQEAQQAQQPQHDAGPQQIFEYENGHVADVAVPEEGGLTVADETSIWESGEGRSLEATAPSDDEE